MPASRADFPFAPLRVTRVLAPGPLPPPRGHAPLTPACTIRPGRLRILATDGAHLYVAASRDVVHIFAIQRSRGLALRALPPAPLVPPTTINNVRMARLGGASVLLMASGHEADDEDPPASLAVLKVPEGGWEQVQPKAIALSIPMVSAWGLDVHEPSGRIALSANSHKIIIVSLEQERLADVLAGRVGHAEEEMSLSECLVFRGEEGDSTHTGNIPCVAFSRCGALLASASLDSWVILQRVFPERGEKGEYAPLVMNTKLVAAHGDKPERPEHAWCVHWLASRAVLGVSASDEVWLSMDVQQIKGNRCGAQKMDCSVPVRKSIFAGGRCNQEREFCGETKGEVVYDDLRGCADDVREVATRDELERHQPYDAEKVKPRYATRSERQRAFKRGRSRCTETAPAGRIPLPDHVESTEEKAKGAAMRGAYDEGTLLLVGRMTSLALCRVKELPDQESEGPDLTHGMEEPARTVEEVDRIFFSRLVSPRHDRFFCVHDVIELERLNAFLVVTKGQGVHLVRVLQECDSVTGLPLRKDPKLFIEKSFACDLPKASDAGGADVDRAIVVGTCVVPRGEQGTPTEAYEVWILWQDGTIECWELSRAELAVDISVVI